MERRVVQLDEMESVLFRLQCVYDTLILIHSVNFSKPLYCAADELMRVTDEFSDLLEKAETVPDAAQVETDNPSDDGL